MTDAAATPRRLWRACRRFKEDRRGSFLVELALTLPVLLIIVIGSFDAGRYVLLHQKLNRAASTMADLVSRPSTISAGQIDLMFSAAAELVQPFDLTGSGHVIVTSVSKAAGDSARVDWQHTGGGSLSATSAVGTTGGSPTLPSGFTVRDGENLIVAEVFFDYEPYFLDFVLEPSVISHVAIRRPRRGDLSTLN